MNDNHPPPLVAALDAVAGLRVRRYKPMAVALRWSALIAWLRFDVRREGVANEP